MIFARTLLFLSLGAAGFSGCVPLVTLNEIPGVGEGGNAAPEVQLPVPFVPQGYFTHDCGPAVAAMLLRHYRLPGEPEEIAEAIRGSGGTYPHDLVRLLQSRGLTVSSREEGTLEEIRRQLRLGNPSVVIQSTFYWPEGWPHFRLVIGYGPGYLLVHDSRFGPNRCMREDDFLRCWDPEHPLLIVVGPADLPDRPASGAAPTSAASRP